MVTLVNGFVGGTVRGLHDRAGAERDTGVTDQQWWEATAPYFARVFDADRYPTVARVGPVAGAELQAAYDPVRTFEFGLERLLDGIGMVIVG